METMYLQFSDFPGECHDSDHPGWLQISKFVFNVDHAASVNRTTGGNDSAGQAQFAPIEIEMYLDSSLPKLAEFAWLGKHIANCTVDMVRSGAGKVLFLQYKFTNCLLTNVRLSAARDGQDELPMVHFTFVYDQVTNEYFITETDNTVSGSVITGYDLKTQVSV